MSAEQLLEILHGKYTVKGAVDLADLSSTPQAAYEFFYSLYQTEFGVDDRIVLYTADSIPNKLLEHLYQAANFVDISNWFVLVCSPVDCAEQLAAVAAQCSSDPVPFQHYTADINWSDEIQDRYHLPDTICAIPWMHLEIKNDGSITPCCTSTGPIIGNITVDTLDDAFHSEHMQSLRSEFLAGNKPKDCNSCWKTEDRGLPSNRMHNSKRLKKQFLLEQLSQPSVVSLDIKFNNTCNFKCRICSPMSSSLIAAEHKKFLNVSIRPQANWGESDQFIDQIIKHLPHLTNIDMYGGEPFLIKRFVNVLKIAVEQGHAKNIRLHYNTNGSVWPEAYIKYWPYFKEVDLHFSIDAVGQRFELQRGGVWQDVENNILRIKQLNFPNMSFSVMPNINIMSVYYLDEVYDWARQHNFNLFPSHLISPGEFGLANLTAEAQQLILDKFHNHPWPEIQNILNFIQTSAPGNGQTFVDQIQWFDSVRQENFAKSHSEIAQAMGYVYNNNL